MSAPQVNSSLMSRMNVRVDAEGDLVVMRVGNSVMTVPFAMVQPA